MKEGERTPNNRVTQGKFRVLVEVSDISAEMAEYTQKFLWSKSGIARCLRVLLTQCRLAEEDPTLLA